MKRSIIAAVLTGTMLTSAVSGCSQSTTAISVSDTLSLAERYLSEMKYEQAIIEFDKVLEIEPNNIGAYIGKADAYIAMGDTESAINTLQTGYDRTGDAAIKAKLDELLALAGAAEAVTTAAETTTAETTTTTTPEETTEETTVEEEPEEEKWWDSYDFVDFDDLSSYAGTEENIVVNLTKAQITPENIELLRSMDVFGVSTQDNDLTNEDVALICSLTGLRYLDLSIYSYVYDLSPAFELTELKYLGFGTGMNHAEGEVYAAGSDPVVDISGIKNLKNLNKLMIWNTCHTTQVVGVENIGELKELRDVSFGCGAFGVNYDPHSLDFLFELPKLTTVDLQYSDLKDISFLSGFTQLTSLTLSGNPIEDYSPLYSLKKLKYLLLWDYYGNHRPITEDELEQLKQNLPDCSTEIYCSTEI